jgi:hypothetical protein
VDREEAILLAGAGGLFLFLGIAMLYLGHRGFGLITSVTGALLFVTALVPRSYILVVTTADRELSKLKFDSADDAEHAKNAIEGKLAALKLHNSGGASSPSLANEAENSSLR